jgi:hypothetical protein
VIARLRRLRMTAAEIAETLAMPLSTVAAVLTRIGLGRLSRLAPPGPPGRYDRRHPGEPVHIDVKKLGRIRDGAGKRFLGQGLRRTHNHGRVTDAAGVRRLGVRPRLRRRRRPARLRRGARGRERPLPPSASHVGLAHLAAPGVQVRRVMTGNGPCYRGSRPYRPRTQRQGRTLHPHAAGRLGLRRHLPRLRRTQPRPRRLARLLQSPPTTRQPQPPATATAAGGTQEEQPGSV